MDILSEAPGDRDASPDIGRASSIAEIQATLAHLSRQEAAVTARLDALVASQKDLSRELGRLDLLRAHLGSQVINARAIGSGMLSDAASTANRISSAVKRLDQEQTNVKATLEVVEQVAELKACVLGVHGSMGAPQDWETAAGYLSRASKIPAEVIDGSFAEQIVPSAEVPDPPRVTLDDAAESLCGLFLREFDKAAKEGDGAKVTRFFKLFPLIGRSDVGLDAYGRYVCHGVASRARSNLNSHTGGAQGKGIFYANTITKLFEHIAQIVDGHEPLVERHYGAGMMVKVIERLQIEADVQGGIVLDTWYDERAVDRKLTDIKSYPFSFLVQSFISNPKPSVGTPRAGSPAVRDGAVGRTSEDEGVDMKEVDSLLGETALILGRWSLYSRFLASKCSVCVPSHHSYNDSYGRQSQESDARPGAEQPGLTMPQFLLNSNLYKKVSKNILEPFNIMTTFYFRRSVEKAFQLDQPPSDLTLNPNKPLGAEPPFITSAVDDVMYIVNQVLQRSLATSQRSVITSVVPVIGRVLGSDFVGMIQRKMRDESYPKAAIQGALPPEDKVIAFLVLNNNLDIAANDYIHRIISAQLGTADDAAPAGSQERPPLADLFPFGHDAAIVATTLQTMQHSFQAKTTELLSEGISVIFAQIMKPRIRSLLTEAFRDIEYSLTADELDALQSGDGIGGGGGGGGGGSGGGGAGSGAGAAGGGVGGAGEASELDELVRGRFERGWRALTLPLKRILTERNFDRLLGVAMPSLNKSLETRVKSYYGRVNELGAVRMERDVAGIIAAAVHGARYSHRDAFQRVQQMCLIMNMEEDEWEEVEKIDDVEEGNRRASIVDMGIQWVLDRDERRRVRGIIKG
jgi:conserved oligomeric Golgi complex subunit 4